MVAAVGLAKSSDLVVLKMSSLSAILEAGKRLQLEGDQLRLFIQEQQAKERDDREREREEKKMQRQMEEEREARADRRAEEEHKRKMELIRAEQEYQSEWDKSGRRRETNPRDTIKKGPKLPAFNEEKDNIDAYIQRFERYATVQNWERDGWGANLSALLTGNALAVFSRLPVHQSLDFDELKKALLRRFDMTGEGFRKSFRTSRPDGSETFSQFSIRLENYLERWVELADTNKTYEGLKDLFLRDQFLQVCNQDLMLFLKERIPVSLDAMSRLADQYVEARRTKAANLISSKGTKAGSHKATASGHSPSTSSTPGKSTIGSSALPKERTCFYCKKVGHIASDCRKKKSDKMKEGQAASMVKDKGNTSGANTIPKNSDYSKEQSYILYM
ncbi:histone-lysine N-methyltransferase, H3 lysine-79 specific-like [Ylistrum balloti]|uniref:histone-lysine N-methyltransferase, H3 lysine-79 specific-like n=1 Tax=Ylistrum balloti TaxID=509963 RepID=UPI002905DA9F|nr:histone-lysine N-methyltransferase, H3 lysine-79 specific-like [Ylistrum balloti]